MRKAHPNLVRVPATKDKKGREKPAHWQTEITVNYKRVRRYAGTTKEEALIYLGELRKAAKEGRLDELIRPAKALPGTAFGEYARALLDSAEWKQKRSHRRDETSLDALNKVFKNVPLDPELAVAIDTLPRIGQYIFSKPDMAKLQIPAIRLVQLTPFGKDLTIANGPTPANLP